MLALLIGLIAPTNWVNLNLTAQQVGDLIMPPGMIMDRDTSAETMRDMAAVDPRLVKARYGMDAIGGRPLEPRLENGVKNFDLDASIIEWQILPGVKVNAYAFNGQVPGPSIRVQQGDRVRINVTNHLPDTTTVHWHGLILPNAMDGPAKITQDPIAHGGVYHYEFRAAQAGTFFYHSHDHIDRQQALGLYGAFIIDPKVPDPSLAANHEYTLQVQEWLFREGLTYPAMPMDGRPAKLFHHQWTLLSCNRDHQDARRRDAQGAFHRFQQWLHSPDQPIRTTFQESASFQRNRLNMTRTV